MNRNNPLLLDLGFGGPRPGDWPPAAVKFSPDGSRLYASVFGPTVVFDTANGAEILQIPGDGLLAVSPDGRRVAVREGSLTVRILDLSNPETTATKPLSSLPLTADFSPDSRRLAIAVGPDIVLVNSDSGEVVETLRAHTGHVIGVEFKPSGELVTVGMDGVIVTWDLGDWSAGFRTDTYFAPTSEFVEQDEHTVVRELSDGSVKAVVAEPAVWRERACEIAGRILTEQEWTAVMGTRPYDPACRD